MGNLLMSYAEHSVVDAGYLSDGLIESHKAKAAHERKKGVPWTEYEHSNFLLGLQELGKGDWRGISKNFVPTRTPTQVASHAQKYFIRMTGTEKKKRRSSLFDMPLKTSPPTPPPPLQSFVASNKGAKISLLGSKSPVSTLKNTSKIQEQASTSAQVANPSEMSQVLPVSTYGVPDIRPMPYTVGVSSSGQSFPASEAFPTVSFVPVMNFPNEGYVCLPRNHGSFANCAPFRSQSLSTLLPKSPSQAGPAPSVTTKDGQELRIGVI
ncbi:hypothetical protein F0562_031430 [Nyssa sinensis]|uniref:Uncharacterized protein n=1 Tax=Nyssa sinensis TaxID=561372 RepID=A0A5J5ASF6_9ASTE|nr:hypothetical protein F0562_031430 [Nyssa sinensis]